MRGAHDIELFFHCAEQCAVEPMTGGFLISRDGVQLKLVLPPSGDSTVHKGEYAPLLGWVSRAFDRRLPTHTIVWRARLSGNALLRTELAVSP